MFYWNGRPLAMGGGRGHNSGGPRCGDENPFGLWIHIVVFIAPNFGGGMFKPTSPKKAGTAHFCHNVTMPPPTQIANDSIWGEFKPTLITPHAPGRLFIGVVPHKLARWDMRSETKIFR